MIKPNKEQLFSVDLFEQHKRTRGGRSVEFLNAEPGVEHYRLLAWISMQYKGAVLTEVGTLDGCGALALSYNPENQVKTYDVRFYDDCADLPDNVERKLVPMGLIDDASMDEIVKSPVIFYDTMHDGVLERDFMDKLLALNYKGIVIWDDIKLNEPMKTFWEQMKCDSMPSEDWSDIGHWSGTGVTFFQ